jgi:hypothetical protein
VHRGDQRHLGRFTGRAEALIERPQQDCTAPKQPWRSTGRGAAVYGRPWILLCPRSVPLSQLNGANPASAAISPCALIRARRCAAAPSIRPGFAPGTWARRIPLSCGLARPGRLRADAPRFSSSLQIQRQYTRAVGAGTRELLTARRSEGYLTHYSKLNIDEILLPVRPST